MPTPNEISSQMASSLAISEPDLDTSIGTPIRKIIDVVAEAISEAYGDKYLLTYQYDIDSRSGADLDSFVALFGFARLPARRSSGTVLLQRTVPATQASLIGSGSQLATSDNPPVVVQTTSPTLFPQNVLSILVPCQSVAGGANTNVAAASIVRMVSPVEGVGSISNPSSFVGGSDAESDAQLRDRFKRTIFRNLAGTEDMYLGVALADSDVLAGNIMGPSERWRERIEIVGGTATSTITQFDRQPSVSISAASNTTPITITTGTNHNLRPGDVVVIAGVTTNTNANGVWRVKGTPTLTTFTIQKIDTLADSVANGAYAGGVAPGITVSYASHARQIYDYGYAFGRDLDSGQILTPGVHYTINTSVIPPVITILDSTNAPDGIYDLSFNYAPWASRNDVAGGIMNRIDAWVAGVRSLLASEVGVLDGRNVFSATQSDQFATTRFKRLDGTNPVAGNIFLPIGFRPILQMVSVALGNATLLNTNYWIVQEVGPAYGSFRSLDGIEISTAAAQAGTIAISSSTNATPIVLTTAAHTFVPGQKVLVAGHTTNTNANGIFTVQAVTGTTVTLTGTIGNGVGGATGTVSLYTPTSTSYYYNDVPRSVQAAIETWRMASTDLLVHYGKRINLKLYVNAILKPGYMQAQVHDTMSTAITAFFNSLGFGATLQVSDLLNIMGDVGGVDAVRFRTSDDILASAKTISGATNASPIVLTVATGHGFVAGDRAFVDGILGNTNANGQWTISATTGTTITLRNSVGNGAYTSGGRILPASFGMVQYQDDLISPLTNAAIGDGTPYRSRDISADDHEYFNLVDVVITTKASNTYTGTG